MLFRFSVYEDFVRSNISLKFDVFFQQQYYRKTL